MSMPAARDEFVWDDVRPDDLLPARWRARTITPALIVSLDRVRENIGRVLSLLGDDPSRWRPHVKTAKISEVHAELIAAGVRTFKCATTRELAILLDDLETRAVTDGDVLLAQPLIGPSLTRVATLAARHPSVRVSVLCEHPTIVAKIPAALGVFVDVNLGMNRTGIPAERVADVVAVAVAARRRLRGVHAYDGHVRSRVAGERRRLAFAVYEQLAALVEQIEAAGAPVAEIVTSGTPTFVDAAAFDGFRRSGAGRVHRVSPGTVIYHDVRNEEDLPELALAPAAFVLTRVVSRPAEHRVTCDAGSKSIAAEAGDPCAHVAGHPNLTALRPSEEHLPLEVTRGAAPQRGTELLLVPRHVCPTVNLAEHAILVERGRPPRVVPVGARAHELVVS